MNVSCPDCRSIFRVDPAKVPPAGVRARCSVCGGVISIPAPTGQSAPPAGRQRPSPTSNEPSPTPRARPRKRRAAGTRRSSASPCNALRLLRRFLRLRHQRRGRPRHPPRRDPPPNRSSAAPRPPPQRRLRRRREFRSLHPRPDARASAISTVRRSVRVRRQQPAIGWGRRCPSFRAVAPRAPTASLVERTERDSSRAVQRHAAPARNAAIRRYSSEC